MKDYVIDEKTNQIIIENFLKQITIAKSMGFFEMRVEEILRRGGELPENMQDLRKNAFARNILMLEDDISLSKNPDYKTMREDELRELKEKYSSYID